MAPELVGMCHVVESEETPPRVRWFNTVSEADKYQRALFDAGIASQYYQYHVVKSPMRYRDPKGFKKELDT